MISRYLKFSFKTYENLHDWSYEELVGEAFEDVSDEVIEVTADGECKDDFTIFWNDRARQLFDAAQLTAVQLELAGNLSFVWGNILVQPTQDFIFEFPLLQRSLTGSVSPEGCAGGSTSSISLESSPA